MKTNRAKLFGIIALVAIIGVTFAACGVKTNPASDFEVRDINGGKEVEITKYIGDKWEVGIPSKIKGFPVTLIGNRAFAGEQLDRVIIPKSVAMIGNYAFYNNQLTSVTIGANVFIGDCAFEDVSGRYIVVNGFEKAYNAAGKKAGTYTRPNINSYDWKKR